MADPTAAQIRLLVLDVDGVLTDGGIRLDDRGVETKRFHVRDGTGIRLWMKLGHEVAIVTGRAGGAVRHRAEELGVELVFQGIADKGAALSDLCDSVGIPLAETAVLGDDLPDLPMLELAGYPMVVADATKEVRDRAAFITVRPGGAGAVREAIEHLIRARGEWSDALAFFGLEDHGEDQ